MVVLLKVSFPHLCLLLMLDAKAIFDGQVIKPPTVMVISLLLLGGFVGPGRVLHATVEGISVPSFSRA